MFNLIYHEILAVIKTQTWTFFPELIFVGQIWLLAE